MKAAKVCMIDGTVMVVALSDNVNVNTIHAELIRSTFARIGESVFMSSMVQSVSIDEPKAING